MKRKSLVSQGTLNRIHLQSQKAWQDRDLRQCVELLERVIHLDSTNTSALCQLGRIHGLLYEYDKAGECFERAYRLAPPDRKAWVLDEAGRQAMDFYDSSLAEHYLGRAVNEKGAAPEMFLRAAEFAEKNRQIDDAALLIDRALKIDPLNAAGLLARAHLEHRAGRHESAERELQPLLQLTVDPEVRVKAWYELGAVLDRQGRYDEAMKAFHQAKALLRHRGEPLRNERQAFLVRSALEMDDLTAEILQRWFRAKQAFHPTHRLALLGGHPRSGTTLLEQVLDSHPEIVTMEESDTYQDYVGVPLLRQFGPNQSFLRCCDSVSMDLLAKLRSDYRRASELCVGSAVGERLLVDKHPSLTLSIPAVIRVFPEIRLLIALRDPRDVVLSCFMQPFVVLSNVSAMFLSLDTAAQEYASLMGTWLKLKSILPNPHLEVRYEEMVEDLEAAARQTLDFLDVPWDERVLGFDAHARSKRVRSPTYADVTQKVFKRAKGRWHNYERYLEPALPKLDPLIKALGYQ